MASANYAKRRRNAILAAIAMALVFIIIVVIIIVGVVGGGRGSNDKNKTTPVNTTDAPTLPTIAPPASNEPDTSADPDVTFDPDTTTPAGATATATATATAPAEAGSIMYVTGDGVNVRKEASADSDKVTSLSKGTAVTAYEKVNGFYSVKLSDGKMGYISSAYLSEDDPKKANVTPTAKPTATPDTTKGVTKYVSGDSVNVRASGSSSADKLASLIKGKQVVAYETVGDWTYIRYGENKYGYISTKYLSDTDPTKATATPTATATSTATATATATPTATPKSKSFADFGVPEAVAKIADQNTSYLRYAAGDGGLGTGVVDGKTTYYNIVTLESGKTINGKDRLYIWYQGSESAPENVQFKFEAPPTA